MVVAQYTVGCMHVSTYHSLHITHKYYRLLCCISMSYAVPMQPTPLGGAVATPTRVEAARSAASGGVGEGHTVGGVGVIVEGATRAILR